MYPSGLHRLTDQDKANRVFFFRQGMDILPYSKAKQTLISIYFRDRNVDDVMRDVRSMARKNPAMVLGGALMAGFMAARFLKASEPIRQEGVGYADRNRAYDYPAARPPAGPDEHPYRPYDTV